jgi:glycerophosphoryl diester phosphodiesterase
VIAHRGGRQRGVRENSLAAFEGAIAVGADFIGSTSAHRRRSAGDQPRSVDDGRAIARVTLERLRALPHGPALLAEVVGPDRRPDRLDVELKEAGYEEEVLAQLGPVLDGAEPVFLSSFLEPAVAAVRRLAPDVAAGLCCAMGAALQRKLAATDATLVLPWWRLDRSPFRARLARHGLPEAAWTGDDPRALGARLRDPGWPA